MMTGSGSWLLLSGAPPGRERNGRLPNPPAGLLAEAVRPG